VTSELLDHIAKTVLYEGYLLYPYRASAIKNRQRFNFGVLVPQDYSSAQTGTEASLMQTEFLVQTNAATVHQASLETRVRFLHLVQRQVMQHTTDASTGAWNMLPVEFLEVDGTRHQSWQEAQEREIASPSCRLTELLNTPLHIDFEFGSSEQVEAIHDRDSKVSGQLHRTQHAIRGTLALQAVQLEPQLFQVRLTILNKTLLPQAEDMARERALLFSFVSAHAVLNIAQGQFVSLLEPAEDLVHAASKCQQVGCWPVLVGRLGERNTMLASPIILYDYPEVAEESPGDFFDGTEMDEMLMLRVLTMTPAEQQEMRQVDEQARRLLERTENLAPDQFLRLHGRLRETK
jgi:hypothetical protein